MEAATKFASATKTACLAGDAFWDSMEDFLEPGRDVEYTTAELCHSLTARYTAQFLAGKSFSIVPSLNVLATLQCCPHKDLTLISCSVVF